MARQTRKSYQKLMKYSDFIDRFEYLVLRGRVGAATFGRSRYLNQMLYSSPQWRKLRDEIIIRDNGCDLGVPGHEIAERATIHHINPITQRDFEIGSDAIWDPDNLITVSYDTHSAIHYGDPNLLKLVMNFERRPNDTTPWKE